MLNFLDSLAAWHWLVLGIVIFGLEALGLGGVFIGAGVAAFTTSLIALSDIEWPVQFGVFAFLSVFFTIIYWKKFRKFNQARDRDEPINNKMAGLVGKTGMVIHGNTGGPAKAQIGDTLWEIRCKQDLQEGDEISVNSYEGMILLVSKLI